MPSKSKAKGNSNEYAIRDILSAWHGKPFFKCPNSGALRWNGVAWVYGDLVPPDDFWVVVEAKHYEEVTFDDILGRRQKQKPGQPALPPSFGTGLVSGWWYGQAVPDAERASRELNRPIEALLVFKQDYHRHRICLRQPLYQSLEEELRKSLVCCWTYIPGKEPFMTLDFEYFLGKVSPSAFQAAFSKLHPSQ